MAPWSKYCSSVRQVSLVTARPALSLSLSPWRKLHWLFTLTQPPRVWNRVDCCDKVSHISPLFDWGYPSTMMNSLCRDEVSASLARCGLLDSDGERFVNDELQSRGKNRDTSSSFSLWTIKDQGGFIGRIQTDSWRYHHISSDCKSQCTKDDTSWLLDRTK